MGFVHVENLTGRCLADKIIEMMKDFGLDGQYLRGQGYDGASSISGKYIYIYIILVLLNLRLF